MKPCPPYGDNKHLHAFKMKSINFEDLPATPWKNGGGVTRELACFPAGASFEDFLWRISIADINRSGPFSVFPGIDRVIALLDGDGMVLNFDDGRTHALNTPLLPFRFRGEDHVCANLAGCASRDINLMLRRGAVDGKMELRRESGAMTCGSGFVALFCAAGQWRITTGNGAAYTLTLRQSVHGACENGSVGFSPLQPDSALLAIHVAHRIKPKPETAHDR